MILKLTKLDGSAIWIQREHIVCFREVSPAGDDRTHTTITPSTGFGSIEVRETPQEICNLIKTGGSI